MSEEQRPVTSGSELPPRERDEKDEKGRREEQEKHNEKEEKERERDPLSSIMLALFLIAAGVILLAENLGWITWDQFGGLWNLFFVGLGLIMLAEALLRLLLPAYRRPVMGQVIGGIVLLVMGVGGMIGFQFTWPVVIIGIGVAILVGGLLGGRL